MKRVLNVLIVLVLIVASAFAGVLYGKSAKDIKEGRRIEEEANKTVDEASADQKKATEKIDIHKLIPRILDLQNLIDDNFLFKYDQDKLLDGIYKGMLQGLEDPYTVYYNPEEYKKLLEETQGQFAGIGIYIDGSGPLITVVSPIEGSPADKAGILAGDQIVAVDGVNYKGDQMDQAVSHMKGKVGTKVKLTIRRKVDGKYKLIDMEIERANIKIDTISSKLLDDGIGYIKIIQFDSPTADDFEKAYEDLKTKGAKKLIIDLRNNPGGLLDVVAKIADKFISDGVIVYQVDKNGKETTIDAKKEAENIPVVILTNKGSASASEILAGSMQDNKKATVVGSQTFGKGIVQRIFPLGLGDKAPAVKMTVSEYFTSSKKKIHGVGIKPDILVDQNPAIQMGPDNLKDDLQLRKAIEVIREK